jgi:hypothetical protein
MFDQTLERFRVLSTQWDDELISLLKWGIDTLWGNLSSSLMKLPQRVPVVVKTHQWKK